ncbi:MAG: hypothetical protein F9K29_04345 [Hyphomicrobiaceae bacterium]|nr:MAG: hypothetical protein F9K29_04345 [Hyphomicrobiaceae bacterium]
MKSLADRIADATRKIAEAERAIEEQRARIAQAHSSGGDTVRLQSVLDAWLDELALLKAGRNLLQSLLDPGETDA